MEDILDIRDVILCYLENNNLSIKYMSKKTGIKEKTLRAWLDRRRNMNADKLKKAYSFLQGDFFLDIETICDSLDVDIDNVPLNQLVKLFIKYNDLSVNKVAKYARMPETTLRNFLNGKSRIREKYAICLREVIKGEYLISFETCCSYLMLQKEGKGNEN